MIKDLDLLNTKLTDHSQISFKDGLRAIPLVDLSIASATRHVISLIRPHLLVSPRPIACHLKRQVLESVPGLAARSS